MHLEDDSGRSWKGEDLARIERTGEQFGYG